MLGKFVGPYQIIEKLGAGGMGEVFLGHDPRLERRVALKCLTSAASITPEGHTRVLREARAVARLTHPHIAGVYDVLEQDGRAFIVMEYVEGISLSAHMAAGALPVAEVRLIGRQLASALAAAHAQGVIHRDLKPANIQVMRDGSIKVLDFGVARLMPSPTATIDTTLGDAAGPHSLGGNPGTAIYMAPEQLIGHVADARTDLYSAGVMLFQMATGRRPYLDTTAVTLALAMNAGPAPAAREINALVPLELSEAIGRALKRDPDHRYQSARELDSALAAMSGTSSATRALNLTGLGERSEVSAAWRRRGSILAAAAVVLLAIGAAAWRPLTRAAGFGRPAAVAIRPAVLAILPVDNPSGDQQAEYLGAGIASVVAQNFSSLTGVTVTTGSLTRPFEKNRDDLEGLRRDAGADFVLDLALRGLSPKPRLMARLRHPGGNVPDWEQTIEGDPLEIERALLDSLGRALEVSGAVARPFSDNEWTRIRKLPTTSGSALMAYSQARALLDRWDMPGNIDGAIHLLEQATTTDPVFALAHAALGDALWKQYQRDRVPAIAERATAEVLEALRIDPWQAQVHYSLAVMYDQTGRPNQAIDSVRRSLQLQPDSDESHRLLGMIDAAKGDIPGAIAEMTEAIRIHPLFWSNHSGMGFVLYTAGRYEDALSAYRRAAELQPTDPRSFAMMGTMHHLLGRMDDAIGNYEHAVRLGPSRTAYSNLGLVYFESKRFPEALAAFKNAAGEDPKSPLMQRNIGDVYAKLDQGRNAAAAYGKAIELGEQILKVNPRDAATISLIATCEAKLGRRAAAQRHASEALVIAPTSRDALVRSAQVHARLGEPEAALRDLAAAIAHGYDKRQAREEDEFAAIRNLPAFQKLVASTQQPRNP